MNRLKSKFALIIGAVYLFIGALTVLVFYAGTDRIIRHLGTRFAEQHALLEKNKILSLIEREVALALKLCDDPLIRKWCTEEDNPRLKELAFDQLESYRTFFRDRSYFIALVKSHRYYYHLGGHGRLETTLLDKDNPADSWFFTHLRSKNDFALNLDYNPAINETKIWINAVVKDGHNDTVAIGGSGLTISDFIREVVLSRTKGISTVLIDKAGVIQAHANDAYVKHNATIRDDAKKITMYGLIANPDERTALRQIIDDLTAGRREVETMDVAIDGRHYLAAVAYMKDIHWYNIVLLDVSQVVRLTDFLPIIVTVILSFLLMLLIIAVMLNRMVLKPLTAMTNASLQVSRGDYTVTVDVQQKDEFGRLASTFNSMTAMVLDHTHNLENKVHERTKELLDVNAKLEESRKQILDSINYARMIQSSILPASLLLSQHLREWFVLYAPRDIVGGDFYYFRSIGDGFLIAVIDCTGHGVPGAFMSMTVNAVLNHVVDTIETVDPAGILGELNRLVRTTLNRDTTSDGIDSGLDIGLCYCIPRERRVVFAGAGIALYLCDGTAVTEIKGDRQRLGYRRSRIDFSHTNHEIAVSAESRLYLTTDGFLDQGDGTRGFGFGRARFKSTIVAASRLPMSDQGDFFLRALHEFSGTAPQRDDIVLLGFSL